MRLVRFLCARQDGIRYPEHQEAAELDGEGYASLSSIRARHRTADLILLARAAEQESVAVGLIRTMPDFGMQAGSPILFLKRRPA